MSLGWKPGRWKVLWGSALQYLLAVWFHPFVLSVGNTQTRRASLEKGPNSSAESPQDNARSGSSHVQQTDVLPVVPLS